MSKELIFRDAEGADYQPVRHYNRKTGKSAFRIKPPGASNETDDCIEVDTIEELAKAMLVDKLPARVKALAGGPVNYLKFGAQKLVAYDLDPAIADQLGVPAVSGAGYSQANRIRRYIIENYVSPARERDESVVELVSGEIHNAMGLQNALPAVCSVLEGKALAEQAKIKLLERHSPIGSDKPSSTIRYRFELQNIVMLDMGAFERLKKAFLARHPDFTSFAETPSFASNEGDYKQALVEEAQRLLVSMRDASDAELGEALIEMLAGRTKLFCNLIDWHAMSVIDKARKANPGLFEAAAGRAVRADSHDQAVVDFVNSIWTPLRGDPPINPYAESRMLSTMLRALVDPQAVLPIRSTPTDNASRMLCGEPAFANAPLSFDEVINVTGMAKEMLRIMDQEWGWAPRHLWDVQGFIWETCQKVLRDVEMTDDEVLIRFDGDERFRVARVAWSSEQKRAFCSIARAVHDAGLDWYHTNIPEIRFGRKDNANRDASGTLGSIQLRTNRAFLAFSHQNDKLGLEGFYDFSDDMAADFASAIEKARLAISDWKPTETKRAGRWPDEYQLDEAKPAGSRATMEPTNLILYGPPGTGKTYRTALEAVRLCDGSADYPATVEGRDALMVRYRELVDARQIEMVTFHQSFSYEEFVEGLRPEADGTSETGGFNLKPESGVFARLAERAQVRVKRGAERLSLDNRAIFKMSLGQSNDPHSAWVFEDSLEQGFAIFGFKDVDWSDQRFANRDAIFAELEARFPEERITSQMGMVKSPDRFRNQLKIGDIIVASKGLNAFRAIGIVEGEYEYAPRPDGRYCHRRKVAWLWSDPDGVPVGELSPDTRFSLDTIYELPRTRLNLQVLERLLNSASDGEGEIGPEGGDLLPHVLIIDEINRANVSKVFGELITLIEPDKRLGMRNALKVRLPYSKREFGVPANLHIIGTMNTADRSIALLDTALRRRFRFEEMAPDTSIPAFIAAENSTGLPLGDVLNTMNRRIEYLVDRDHRIGHAFFIGCESKADVHAVMRDKVIPLLQEYFFDDWNRLAAVLGEKDKGGNFLTCEIIEDPMGEGGEPLKSWRVRSQFDEGAYIRLVSGRTSSLSDLEDEA